MKLPAVLLTSVMVTGSLAGCGVKYGCPAPGGVQCKPISEVYRSVGQTSGATQMGKGLVTPPKMSSASGGVESSTGAEPDGPVPIRSAPKILRVWVTPWIDAEGDLHQQSYLYVVVDHGAWALGLPAVEPQSASKLGKVPEDKQQVGSEKNAK